MDFKHISPQCEGTLTTRKPYCPICADLLIEERDQWIGRWKEEARRNTELMRDNRVMSDAVVSTTINYRAAVELLKETTDPEFWLKTDKTDWMARVSVYLSTASSGDEAVGGERG